MKMTRGPIKSIRSVFLLIPLLLSLASATHAQSAAIDGVDARSNPAEFTKQLSSPDSNVRQRSAEALARLAATSERKLVEGYQLQEKNKEVRLALDWALYRMGRSEALYRIVRDLDSGRTLGRSRDRWWSRVARRVGRSQCPRRARAPSMESRVQLVKPSDGH